MEAIFITGIVLAYIGISKLVKGIQYNQRRAVILRRLGL
jgi:hypothetical protein